MNNMRNKILSLLVLLMTAASGAWAEKVTVTFTQDDLNGTSTVAKDGVTLTPGNNDAHNYADLYDSGSTTFSVDKGTFTKIEIVNCTKGEIGGWQKEQTGSFQPDPEGEPEFWQNLYTLTWTGEAKSVTFTANVYNIQSIVFTIDKPDVEVNTDKTTGETTFTEATFKMPAFDATVDYELVRDMGFAVNAVMPVSIRIQQKQQGGGYEPVNPSEITPEVKDAIDGEGQAVTMNVVPEQTAETGDYTLKLQKLGDGETWVDADPNDLSVGTYRYEVTGANLYDGVCYTNEFKLFEGYPVTVPAHGFVTYYSDENLSIDDEDATLYTITAVSGTKAVLSSAINVAPANTPLIIYNTSDEPKTFLLIPTDGDADEVSYAAQFKGTLVDREMPGSDDETDYYVCNGFDFAWVKQAGTLAANRCWIEITNQSQGARTINIVFGDGTGLTAVSGSPADNGDIYDLNGRKVVHGTSSNATLRKGVYIRNGKKVIKK